MAAYESIWSGRESLTEMLERDYAAMTGDDWDLIWVPPSPLTTPWEHATPFAHPDPEAFVTTAFAKKSTRRRVSTAIAKDWQRTYTGRIQHVGGKKGKGC